MSDRPAQQDEAAVVGSSLCHLLASSLVEDNCLAGLKFYYYARLGRFGGAPYRELQRNLGDADFARVRDAKIMIVEENESFVARTGYLNELRAVANRP